MKSIQNQNQNQNEKIDKLINTTPTNLIYLIMIVKDEEHVIGQTLTNIAKHIPLAGYFISDTGSTDKTIDIIIETSKLLNISGLIFKHEWKDFAHNRNLILNEARQRIITAQTENTSITDEKTEPYLFMFDADDKIHSYSSNLSINFPQTLTADAYSFIFKSNNFYYNRPLLIKVSSSWSYEGIIHEYLDDKSPEKSNITICIDGDYSIESGKTGSRNKDPNKYLNDAIKLEEALNDANTNPELLSRYAFYCAQSWKDFGQTEKAIFWYKKVIKKYNNWNEEKYYACLKLAELYNKQKNGKKGIYYLLLASSYNQQRLEAITELAKIYLIKQKYNTAHNLLIPYVDTILETNHVSNRWLFASHITHTYDAVLQLALSSYYTNDCHTMTKAVLELCKRFRNGLSTQIMEFATAFLNGLEYYLKKMQFDKIEDLFDMFDNLKYILVDYSHQTSLEDAHQIRTKFETCFTQLLFDDTNSILFDITKNENLFDIIQNKIKQLKLKKQKQRSNNNHKITKAHNGKNSKNKCEIIVTITTCKRLDYFLKTVTSMLLTFGDDDLQMINRWFIVDDGSSDKDKCLMQKYFPFFELIENNGHGHRDSMNTIYDLLVNYQPTYWLHLEDDWVFMKKQNYVQQGIQYLENPSCMMSSNNVKQVLFNKGYGETIGDVIVPCGKMIIVNDNNFLVHVKQSEQPIDINHNIIPNCNKWAHYSFRPSLTKVDTILELGNFNSSNKFFEADYARRYYENGYKSGYLNDITCLHIGKLSGYRGVGSSNNANKSAYEINNISQF